MICERGLNGISPGFLGNASGFIDHDEVEILATNGIGRIHRIDPEPAIVAGELDNALGAIDDYSIKIAENTCGLFGASPERAPKAIGGNDPGDFMTVPCLRYRKPGSENRLAPASPHR